MLTDYSQMMLEQGALRRAEQLCREALQLGRPYVSLGLPRFEGNHIRMARIQLEWNQLDSARDHASTALQLATQWEGTPPIVQSHLPLADIHRAQGDHPVAQEAIA